MKIHHLRSATFVIESGKHFILVDPMLGKKDRYRLFQSSALKHKKTR